MADKMIVEWIRDKYQPLRRSFNERSRRLWAAAEARSLGWGGVAAVMAATGMSSATLSRGLKELEAEAASGEGELPGNRVRRAGGGRRRVRDNQPGLSQALAALVEPTARGDPEHALRWTCKSTRKLAVELRKQGFQIGARTVAKELKQQEFSLQSNRKTREGSFHPDRMQLRTSTNSVGPRAGDSSDLGGHEGNWAFQNSGGYGWRRRKSAGP